MAGIGVSLLLIRTELISFSRPLEISKSVLDWESKHNTETSPEFSMDTFRKLHTWNGQIPRTNLIILTYMRSGSTLTGGMFDQHPDVFYVFEPIHSLNWIWRSHFRLLSYFDRPSRRITSSDSFAELAIDIAEAFLRCRPDKIDIATLSQDHFKYSENTKPYLKCLKANPGVLGMLQCLSILQNQCSQSNVSVVKTIRLQMEAVETMMKSNPSLKVVHLVRDPRPTIRSQMGVNRNWNNLDSYSKIHCLRVRKDLEVTKRLMKSHPDRTKLLLYEDLVAYPAKTVKDLFSFVGLVYTRDTERFVQSKTNSSTGEPCQVCIREGNSTSISLKWRQEFDFEQTRVIDANCKPVYQMLGYLPANSRNELVDLSKSLKIDREF
ncbi:carbohydrate sulfotransferase 5-like [Haliotis rufescens]|uniref:carbohydrate sulfotransferase 5-like n=1 Tax=Haliotis rufescens TaxID=6454 RepID=UPI00201EC81A|nr:carbohydrate sulfotransferase 5-like [Haliotis rufescens]